MNSKKHHHIPPRMTGDVGQILEQAMRICDIAQEVMYACSHGTMIDPYARNKIAGGSLAQDAAVLGIMLVQYEMREENDNE